MAFPVILVDSTNGAASDTACSGAGPTTAKTGSLAAINTNTTVNITDVVDLSGVAVDGSACLYVADATGGDRRFARITNITGGSGAWVVTTAEAYSRTTTGLSWAIGGVRATAFGTVSLLLFDNNGAAGDAMPGWTVQMQSGHAESISAAVNMRRAGDTTSGPITLAGTGATKPIITSTSAGDGFVPRGAGLNFKNFWLKANAANAVAFACNTQSLCSYVGLKIYNGTGTWLYGFNGWGTACKFVACDVSGTTSHCMNDNGVQASFLIQNCWLHDTAAGTFHGIHSTGDTLNGEIQGNIISGCGSRGINITAINSGLRSWRITGNTIYNNGGDGIQIAGGVADGLTNIQVDNNILSNNGAYGLNMSGVSDANLAGDGFMAQGNATYLNTSGAYHSTTGGYTNSSCPWASGDTGLNPTFTSAGGGDFSIGTNLKAQGYPLGGTLPVGTTSSTYSYVDPGAAQRVEPAGGGGTVAQITGARSIGTY